MLESQSQKVLGLLGAELHQSAFSSMAVRRKRYRPRRRETGIRIRRPRRRKTGIRIGRPRRRETGIRIGLLTHVCWKTKTFLPRVTVTLTIQTVNLLYW